MTLTDLIVSVAGKAGITADSDLLKDIVSNSELIKVSVPDELAANINKNIHSLASARASLYNTIRAEALNSVDKTISDYAINEGWMPDDVEALTKETNTFKKITIALEKLKAIESGKVKDTSGSKTKELHDKINELQSQLTKNQVAHEEALNAKQKAFDDNIINYMLQSTLSGYQYGIPIDDNDAKIEVARTLVSKALASNQARLVNDNGQLKLVSNDGTDYFDKTTNTIRSAKDMIEGALTPILKKHEGAPGAPQGRQFQHQQTTRTDNVNEDALALLDASIAQMNGK